MRNCTHNPLFDRAARQNIFKYFISILKLISSGGDCKSIQLVATEDEEEARVLHAQRALLGTRYAALGPERIAA